LTRLRRGATLQRVLTPGQRALLFQACWEHAVAHCARCRVSFKPRQLNDLFRGYSHLCPRCRRDLSGSIRQHLIACATATLLASHDVVAEAKVLRERSTKIRKNAHRLRDAASVVTAEAQPSTFRGRHTRDKRADRRKGTPPKRK
jgi:hypothetical protein